MLTSRQARREQNEPREGIVVWLTGLSSAGKSTIAARLCDRLRYLGHDCEWLDGDLVRERLGHLGFSRADRDANVKRIGYIAALLARHEVTVVVSAISPYRDARDAVRRQVSNFVEVFVNAPLAVCEQRDVKGLYRRARAGTLSNLTGVDDPYEPPLNAEVECRTDCEPLDACVDRICAYLECCEASRAPVAAKSVGRPLQ